MLHISAGCLGIQEGSFSSVNWWVKALLCVCFDDVLLRHFCILVTKEMTLLRNCGDLLIDGQFVDDHVL